MTADANTGLAGVAVTVDGHLGARLDGVEHALGLVVGRVAKVQIAAKMYRSPLTNHLHSEACTKAD